MLVLCWSRWLRLHFLDDASSLAERDVGVAADSEARVEVPAAGGPGQLLLLMSFADSEADSSSSATQSFANWATAGEPLAPPTTRPFACFKFVYRKRRKSSAFKVVGDPSLASLS